MRSLGSVFVVASLSIACAACSSSPPALSTPPAPTAPGGSASGAVGGELLVVRDALTWQTGVAAAGPGKVSAETVIGLDDETGACARVNDAITNRLYMTKLSLQLISEHSEIAPAVYTIDQTTGGVLARATFQHKGALCNDAGAPPGDFASSGTITIDSFSASGAAGSFDLVFPDGALKGTFSAPACLVGVGGVPQADASTGLCGT